MLIFLVTARIWLLRRGRRPARRTKLCVSVEFSGTQLSQTSPLSGRATWAKLTVSPRTLGTKHQRTTLLGKSPGCWLSTRSSMASSVSSARNAANQATDRRTPKSARAARGTNKAQRTMPLEATKPPSEARSSPGRTSIAQLGRAEQAELPGPHQDGSPITVRTWYRARVAADRGRPRPGRCLPTRRTAGR
jgi:hypothetical protein